MSFRSPSHHLCNVVSASEVQQVLLSVVGGRVVHFYPFGFGVITTTAYGRVCFDNAVTNARCCPLVSTSCDTATNALFFTASQICCALRRLMFFSVAPCLSFIVEVLVLVSGDIAYE